MAFEYSTIANPSAAERLHSKFNIETPNLARSGLGNHITVLKFAERLSETRYFSSTFVLRSLSAQEQMPSGLRKNEVMLDYALTSFVTLFVVVDPIGLIPSFIAATQDIPMMSRRRTGILAVLISAFILISAAMIGNWLLNCLGISLAAFRISGGILLFAVASEMVLGFRGVREERQVEQAVEDHVRNVAAFPLATPLIAGPGAITATILLAGSADQSARLGLLILVILVVLCCCAAAFLLAVRLSRAFGRIGNAVTSRLLGIILAALAVQFAIDGIRTAFGSS